MKILGRTVWFCVLLLQVHFYTGCNGASTGKKQLLHIHKITGIKIQDVSRQKERMLETGQQREFTAKWNTAKEAGSSQPLNRYTIWVYFKKGDSARFSASQDYIMEEGGNGKVYSIGDTSYFNQLLH